MAQYKGRNITLNKPFRLMGENKKFGVYVNNPKTGNVNVVKFGQPGMNIQRNNPARRKAFNDRFDCESAKDKTTARYWSCWAWKPSSKLP